jgi:hypothetical protein
MNEFQILTSISHRPDLFIKLCKGSLGVQENKSPTDAFMCAFSETAWQFLKISQVFSREW